jgi:hypothetical protein
VEETLYDVRCEEQDTFATKLCVILTVQNKLSLPQNLCNVYYDEHCIFVKEILCNSRSEEQDIFAIKLFVMSHVKNNTSF